MDLKFPRSAKARKFDFKTAGGAAHITTARGLFFPLTSDYQGDEVPDPEIKNTSLFIVFSNLRSKVEQGNEIHLSDDVYVITGYKPFFGLTQIVALKSGTVASVSSETGIVSQWTFGDQNDLGNDKQGLNPLTSVNTPAYSSDDESNSDPADGSVDLERGNSERLEITDGSQQSLDITGDISILVRLKLESIPSASNVVTKSDGGGGSARAYEMWIDSGGKVRFGLSSDGTNATTAIGGTALSTGTWYTVAAVYNSTDIRIYVDGVLDSNGSNNPKSYTSGIFDSGQKFVIGARSDAANHFDGKIGDVRIYNSAKTSGEISTWHSTGTT